MMPQLQNWYTNWKSGFGYIRLPLDILFCFVCCCCFLSCELKTAVPINDTHVHETVYHDIGYYKGN